MRWRRGCLVVGALFTESAFALDVSWLYRFAVREGCPPHCCFMLPSPWDRLSDWLERGRYYPLADMLCRYEWRELVVLLGAAVVLAVILFVMLRRLDAFRWRFRTRTALLVVALAAFQWTGVRGFWERVDAWEEVQLRSGSLLEYGCCLDTWIWGQDQ
jgi:hypothetical protein